MAKFQNYLGRIPSQRTQAALRGIFSQFLTDGDPPALKDLVLASIVLSGAETTQITISGASTTGFLQSGTSTTAYSITGAFTTGINIAADGTTAIAVTSAFSGVTGLSLAGTASGDGILISGACADGIHISGTNTASGLHISGDQVDSILIDVDAATVNGISISVDDGITATAGISLSRSGTTGICTTGIKIDTDGTTALWIGSGFTGTTGILLDGTATNGLSIVGACTAGVSVGAASTTALTSACATDSTSVSTGSINTAGGLGVAKKTFLGDTVVVTDAKAVIQGMNAFPKVTVTSLTSAAAVTLTAAQVIGGMIIDTVSEANAATLPVPADIVAAIPNCKVGTSFDLVYKNAAGGAYTITVTANGSSTIVGTATIVQNNTKIFRAVVTNITGAAEAVVFYSVGTLVH